MYSTGCNTFNVLSWIKCPRMLIRRLINSFETFPLLACCNTKQSQYKIIQNQKETKEYSIVCISRCLSMPRWLLPIRFVHYASDQIVIGSNWLKRWIEYFLCNRIIDALILMWTNEVHMLKDEGFRSIWVTMTGLKKKTMSNDFRNQLIEKL